MNARTILPLALALLGAQVAPALAQDAFPPRATYGGEFARKYPEASRLLDAVEASRAAVLGRLATSGAGPALEAEAYGALAEMLEEGRRVRGGGEIAGLDARVQEVLTRGSVLRRQVLDIAADDRVTDKAAAVDRVVAAYLSRPEVALSAQPKSREVLRVLPEAEGAGAHAGHAMPAAADEHAGHEMPAVADEHAGHAMPMAHAGHGAAAAPSFWDAHPRLGGALRAQQWLENALQEPLLFYATEAERRAGVEEAVRRFRAMFAGAPETFPYEMPTTAAIAPELSMDHVRAAVVLNHLHMLEAAIVEILASPLVTDKPAAVAAAVDSFTDPAALTVSDYDWVLQSLRPGIYAQGGPVIGTMERSDRNADSRFNQNHEGHEVMPGMPGPGAM